MAVAIRGGKRDLVGLRHIIRVHGLRVHIPHPAIDRAAIAFDLQRPIEPSDFHRIGKGVVGGVIIAVIDRRFRPPDARFECGQFGQRGGFGRRIHPFCVADLVGIGGFQIVDQFGHLLVGIGGPMRGQIDRPDILPQGTIKHVHGAFPARPLLRHAAQHGAVKREMRLIERGRQIGRMIADQAKHEVVFPQLDRIGRQMMPDRTHALGSPTTTTSACGRPILPSIASHAMPGAKVASLARSTGL